MSDGPTRSLFRPSFWPEVLAAYRSGRGGGLDVEVSCGGGGGGGGGGVILCHGLVLAALSETLEFALFGAEGAEAQDARTRVHLPEWDEGQVSRSLKLSKDDST